MTNSNLFTRQTGPNTLGPGYTDGGRFAAPSVGPNLSPFGSTPPRSSLMALRGLLPVIASYAADDVINQVGRIAKTWVADTTAWEFFNRATTFSPHTPISGLATVSGGTGTIVLNVPPVGFSTIADDAFLGFDYRIMGLTIDIQTSALQQPSAVTLDITGTFESLEPYTQHIEVQPGHLGLSRYVLFFTHEIQGGAYPQLLKLSGGVLLMPSGTHLHLDAAEVVTDFTIAAGFPVRAPGNSITVNISNTADGIGVRVETLSPISQLYDWAQGLWAGYDDAG